MQNENLLDKRQAPTVVGSGGFVKPRPTPANIIFVASVILPQTLIAGIQNAAGHKMVGLLNAVVVLTWLVMPCSDKQFGRGRRFFWIRQTVFGIGAIITLLAAVA